MVLEVYQRPYDGNEVVHGETSKQLVNETRCRVPQRPAYSLE